MRVFMIFLMLFFTACSTKEYKLFQEESTNEVFEPQELNITYSSKIVPSDILVIDIYNMNRKSNIMMSTGTSSISIDNTYMVYPDGTILLPLLNSVKVEGLTVQELNMKLTKEYKKFLKKPYVKANIKNHKVFVLGEVKTKGVVPIEGETISLIEVIARSGGLTDHAMRDRIRIISEENGKYILSTLDLNQLNTLNSHNLMLKHNSIVYVEPKNTKAINVTIKDYLPILQAVSSVLGTFLTIDYVAN